MWLLLWQSLNIYWTVPVMLVLLASLVTAYAIARTDRPEPPPALERWAVRAPLGVYLGLDPGRHDRQHIERAVRHTVERLGHPAEWWGAVVLVVGAVLAFAGLARHGDCVFAGVFVWAFAGIAAATPSAIVRTVAGALAAAIGVGIAVSVIARRRLV